MENKYYSDYAVYVNKLSIPIQIKNCLIENGKAKTSEIYLRYPCLFNTVFNISNDILLKKLCVSGALYYFSVLQLDSMIDKTEEINSFSPILLSICQEESIRILCDLFPFNSSFWNFWYKRKNEYILAMMRENEISEKSITNIEEFYWLADNKSAFGKIALDALYCLNREIETETYNKLLESHKYYSIAVQLLDDT